MSKKSLVVLLVLAVSLSCIGLGAFAQDEENTSDTPQATATPEISATPHATATPEVSATPQATAIPEASEVPQATATPLVSAIPTPTAQPREDKDKDKDKDNDRKERHKQIKEKLEAQKQKLAEAKIEAKELLKDIRELFADADSATKKEILSEMAKLKKDLKDLSIGTFMKGKHVDYDRYDGVKPIIKDNRTLVPVRAISETFGALVQWTQETNTITITKDDITIVMQIDNKKATVNGNVVELEVAPTIIKDRTLVPIRFISEAFKLSVEWDEDSQTIVIE